MDQKLKLLRAYTDAGLHIFPCRARGKEPLTSDGFKSATSDWQQIQKWLTQHPNCNWALATGPSGLLAVDYDPANGGTAESLNEEIGMTPETWTQITGSGGMHEFYRRPSNLQLSQMNGVLPGIDIRGTTGYIMVEPSIHPNGKPYQWSLSPFDGPVTDAPLNLVKFLTEASNNEVSPLKDMQLNSEGEFHFTAGERFQNLRALAGKLRAMGFSQKTLYETMLAVFENQCDPADNYKIKMAELSRWICTKPAKPQNRKVFMTNTKGVRVRIPEAQLEQALRQGYKK